MKSVSFNNLSFKLAFKSLNLSYQVTLISNSLRFTYNLYQTLNSVIIKNYSTSLSDGNPYPQTLTTSLLHLVETSIFYCLPAYLPSCSSLSLCTLYWNVYHLHYLADMLNFLTSLAYPNNTKSMLSNSAFSSTPRKQHNNMIWHDKKFSLCCQRGTQNCQ